MRTPSKYAAALVALCILGLLNLATALPARSLWYGGVPNAACDRPAGHAATVLRLLHLDAQHGVQAGYVNAILEEIEDFQDIFPNPPCKYIVTSAHPVLARRRLVASSALSGARTRFVRRHLFSLLSVYRI